MLLAWKRDAEREAHEALKASELTPAASRLAPGWREFAVTGETASIATGGSVTEATGIECPPYWFSGPSTIVLGRSPKPAPDPTTITVASWEIAVDPDTIASTERAFVVFACIRNFGGLHTLKEGGWAWIWLNDHCVDAFRLLVRAPGHSDFFHRPPVPHLPDGFVFSDCQTVYAWPVTRRTLADGPVQRLRVQIDPDVRWDIDYVAIIIAKGAHNATAFPPQRI